MLSRVVRCASLVLLFAGCAAKNAAVQRDGAGESPGGQGGSAGGQGGSTGGVGGGGGNQASGGGTGGGPVVPPDAGAETAPEDHPDAAIDVKAPLDRPADAGGTIQKIGFGSCERLSMPQDFWPTIIARHPEIFLFLGDAIYSDHDETYEQLAAIPGFKQLIGMVQPLVIWDDHDYGNNDSGASFPGKVASKDRFIRFWEKYGAVSPDSPRRTREGNYDAVIQGAPGREIQVIMLDNRWWKGSPPNGAVLGPEEWTWLAEQLKKPARLRLVMSGMELISSSTTPEGWGLFLKEQQHFYDVVKASGAKGVIVLSGDKHYLEVSRRDVGLGYPLYDFTSSPMSAPPEPLEANLYRDMPSSSISEHNFGLITIDWGAPDPTLLFEFIHSYKGNVLLEKRLTLGALGN
jgi:alkaline phosphatase D